MIICITYNSPGIFSPGWLGNFKDRITSINTPQLAQPANRSNLLPAEQLRRKMFSARHRPLCPGLYLWICPCSHLDFLGKGLSEALLTAGTAFRWWHKQLCTWLGTWQTAAPDLLEPGNPSICSLKPLFLCLLSSGQDSHYCSPQQEEKIVWFSF